VKISGMCRLDAQVYVYAILLIGNIVVINFISNHHFVTIFIIVSMYLSGDKTSIFKFRFNFVKTKCSNLTSLFDLDDKILE